MDQILEPVLALCEDLDSARSLSVAILARYGLWSEAQRLRPFAPRDFLDPSTYLRNHAPGEFLRKTELPAEKRRLEQEAEKAFFAIEAQNCTTNARLSRFLPRSLLLESEGDVRIHEFLVGVRKDIRRCLGVLPRSLTPRFSGGATVGDVGKLTTIPDKMSGRAQLYPASACILPLWWDTAWGRCSHENHPRYTRSNKFFSVPKDSTKNRGCAKEASINVAYQLAVGEILREKLRSWGIDLKRGQMVHQALAREASVTGHLCTIDLSNASDTLAKCLVELLLPEEWFTLLNSLRAPFTDVGGRIVRLEKFSSMGNGFTFELESLIFAALARGVGGVTATVKVVGDDIITESEHARDLLAVLRFCGFTPNERKTFTEGPFRESCGGDYWGGQDVRPVYLDKPPSEPHHLMALANALRSFRERTSAISLRPWRKVIDLIPGHVRRCRGPSELGDLVIHDDESRWRVRVERRSGYDIRSYQVWMPVPLILPWSHWRPDVALASVTLCDSAGVTPREGVKGYRLGWVQDPVGRCTWLPRA